MQIEEAIEEIEYAKSFGTSGAVPRWEAIETVLNELEKKDKVIDLIARMLNRNDIDEDICRQMGKNIINCNEYDNEENCINCIKEYFYKKVEGKE